MFWITNEYERVKKLSSFENAGITEIVSINSIQNKKNNRFVRRKMMPAIRQ
jgi:hypothetical protein